MIKPGEIQQKARKAGVRDQQIEKDYVISWILYGIAAHDLLSEVLVIPTFRSTDCCVIPSKRS